MAAKVEYKSTIVLEFITKKKTPSGEIQPVDPDAFHATLETPTSPPQPIANLRVEKVDTGRFFVYFYADPNIVLINQAYYVAFYWQYEGIKMCEREMVIVVADV